MAGILTYALHYEGAFNKNSLGAVAEAAKLASELGTEAHVLVLGDSVSDDLAASLGGYGAQKVFKVSGPIVTATISSTSTAPPSRICMAASMACVSYGFRFLSPLRSKRPVDGLIRLSTAASGTSLTRTQIFTFKAS